MKKKNNKKNMRCHFTHTTVDVIQTHVLYVIEELFQSNVAAVYIFHNIKTTMSLIYMILFYLIEGVGDILSIMICKCKIVKT